MKIGVPKETFPDERRVAAVPQTVAAFKKQGYEVLLEQGAGTAAGWDDQQYAEQGATLVSSRQEVFAQADVVLQVRSFGANPNALSDLDLLRQGQAVVGFCEPLSEGATMKEVAARGVNLLAMELIPRTTRAQSMDALSSMATVAGYKAVLMAADAVNKMFPMLMTAAGTIRPARVFVVGAGVAGLRAIATARALGAVVEAYDVRPAVKEEVESLGAKFLELGLETEEAQTAGGYAKAFDEAFYAKQRELMAKALIENHVVITTAAVPGKKAPVLLTEPMVKDMQPGSVIVDLAAERGGNCELTQPGKTIQVHGVTIIGPVNLPSAIPMDASLMYARNLANLVHHLTREEGQLHLDLEDDIVQGLLVCREGEVVHPRVREALGLPPLEAPAEKQQ